VIGSLIEDAASLGGLARSCEIFNVSQLVLGERGAYNVSCLAAASCLVLQHILFLEHF
jgi:tRNA G18 (ribose-2'-O)-methylase SpoU